ncbi:MAG: YicC family protein [Planctomycetota bacterium]|nr:YicC family protein [Planctomycetota bacterium]
MPRAKPPAQPAVRSMTGYGRYALESESGRCVAEIRSVNGRFLKLTFKLPPRFGALEERVKDLLNHRGVRRGSVEVALYLDEAARGLGGHRLDADALSRYAEQYRALAKTLKTDAKPPLHALLGLPGAVVRVEPDEDLEGVWARIEPALLQALDRFDGMREKEGRALAGDIRAQLEGLRAHRAELLAQAPAAQKLAGQRLRERVQRLLDENGAAGRVSAADLEREMVLLSDRMDVSEELARLDSHLAQMDATLAAGGEAGKKLDFLTQELNREVNTIGSKANDDAITHRVVEMKQLVEKIREQVQNLE